MIHFYKEPSYEKEGRRLIKEGKAGCLILAGGQATRLGYNKPKGLYPLSTVKKRPLFQIFAERALHSGRGAPLAIMTSTLTDKETLAFFNEHQNFGLEIDFMVQNNLPFLDENKNPIKNIPPAPQGNGEAIELFYKEIYPSWKKRGVEYLNVILVDNALGEPFDAELIGALSRSNASILAKAVERKSPSEKVGIFFTEGDKIFVKEYSEISEAEKREKHPFANISSFAVRMEAIPHLATIDLPIHLAVKKISNEAGAETALKQERFIFDLFPYTRTELFVVPRSKSFAPLKNREGEDSPETVQKALLERDKMRYQLLTGKAPEEELFELPEALHYEKTSE